MSSTDRAARRRARLWTTSTQTQQAKTAPANRAGKQPAGGNTAAGGETGWTTRGRVPDWRAGTLHRLGRHTVPHLATAATAVGGLATWAIAAATGDAGAVAAYTALAGYTTLGVWWFGFRSSVDHPPWRYRVLAGGVTAATWVALASFGIGPGSMALLLAADYTLGARWWRHHRIPTTTAAPTPSGDSPESEPRRDPMLDEFQQAWTNNVEPNTLNGSRLVDPDPFAHGFRYVAALKKGKDTLDSLRQNHTKVASGLGLEATDMIVEPLSRDTQDRTGRRGPAWASITLITRSPVAAGSTVWDGPRVTPAGVELGPWLDGAGEEELVLYSQDSMWSSFLLGGTGLGKSRVVANAGLSIMARGDTLIIYIDPKGGLSSPELRDRAHWYVPGDQVAVEPVLEALKAAVEYRGADLARRTGGRFTPSPETPGVLAIVDECHEVFGRDGTGWAAVARAGRQVGAGLLGVSQYNDLSVFGNADPLRASMLMGNPMVMHVRSNSAGPMIPGLEMNPTEVPDEPGYVFSQGSRRLGTRSAPWYNRLVDPEVGREVAAGLPEVEPDPFLAQIFAHFGGEAYTQRQVDPNERSAASVAVAEAIDRGDWEQVERLQHPGRDTATLTRPAAATPPAGAGSMPANVTPFPDPFDFTETLRTGPADTPPAGAGSLELTSSHRSVLHTVAGGKQRPTEIQKQLGLGKTRVATLLRELVEAGYLTQSRHGVYEANQHQYAS